MSLDLRCKRCVHCVGPCGCGCGGYKCSCEKLFEANNVKESAVRRGFVSVIRDDMEGCSFEPKEEDPMLIIEGSHNEEWAIMPSGEPVPKNSNQGREHCYICGIKTVKVDTGMFTIYDICPKCKV